MYTSKQLLQQARIGSAKTLTRWHQRGLIPAPTIGTHPNGRGKIAYWEDSVLAQCIQIRRLLSEGKTLDEIAEIVGAKQRKEEVQAGTEPYDFATVMKRLVQTEAEDAFATQARDKATGFIVHIRRNWKQIHQRIDELLDDPVAIDRFRESVEKGERPILLYDGDQARFVTAHDLVRIVASPELAAKGFIVIPLVGEFVSSFQEVRRLAGEPKLRKRVPREKGNHRQRRKKASPENN